MSHAVSLLQNQQFIVIVPAAGVGKRMLATQPKQYLMLNNQCILTHTVNRLLSHKNITRVVLALSDEDAYFAQTTLAQNPKVTRVSGGKERVDSVLSGLQTIDDNAWVLVHDAARPCVAHEDIDKLIAQCLLNNSGGILGVPVVDTMKRTTSCNKKQKVMVKQTIERSHLWHAFTPQMFKAQELKHAIEQAKINNIDITNIISVQMVSKELVNYPTIRTSNP